MLKKLKGAKSKDKAAALPPAANDAVKQLDARVGLDSYRDFFTLKNYWKTVDRKRVESAGIFFARCMGSGSSSPAGSPKGEKGAAAEAAPPGAPGVEEVPPQYDSRLPFANYRELYTMKNYWKTVRRQEKPAAAEMYARYLTAQPDNKAMYGKLKNVGTVDPSCSDAGFEAVAGAYLKVFDDVITSVEEKPADVTTACDRLIAVGRMHRSKVSGMQPSSFQTMEEPFLHMIEQILQDRYNEKAETLFRKFFQFCLKYLLEGFDK